jgi:hypothetical protein
VRLIPLARALLYLELSLHVSISGEFIRSASACALILLAGVVAYREISSCVITPLLAFTAGDELATKVLCVRFFYLGGILTLLLVGRL